MRLFIFESNAKTGLRAFVGDVAGRNLPDQFNPSRQIGAVASGNAPPYNLSRDTIEKAISSQGFQLWRFKPKMAQSSLASPDPTENSAASSDQLSSRAVGA